MLNNNKSILLYGITEEEEKKISEFGFKTIKISDYMAEMTLEDILNGLKFSIVKKDMPKEKVVLFNNFADGELSTLANSVRSIIGDCILAIVTPTSIKWKVNYLVNHLAEERDWVLSQKGRSESE